MTGDEIKDRLIEELRAEREKLAELVQLTRRNAEERLSKADSDFRNDIQRLEKVLEEEERRADLIELELLEWISGRTLLDSKDMRQNILRRQHSARRKEILEKWERIHDRKWRDKIG